VRRILSFSAAVAAAALLLISVGVTADVLIRWTTGHPITGVFELSGLALVVVIFFSLGFMQYEKLQIRVDIITSHARGRWAAAVDLLEAAAGLTVFGLLLWAAGKEFLKAYQGSFLLRGMIEIPTTVEIGFILYGTALILIALVRLLVISARALAHSGKTDPSPK
jgi:TRAP-type C4-dicarboxylate transport system permease small subunit